MSVVLIGFLFSLLSFGAIEGGRSEKSDFTDIKKFVPWAFKKIGYDVFAEFQEKDVSEKPANYWQIPENNLPKYVKGATLKNRNLENADMSEAFLVKADLRKGKLQNVHLKDANLQNANLEGADLQNASLLDADLQNINLKGADLTGAKNLTIEQLSKVKTLYQASLDHELFKEVNKCCPHLLEQQKEEIDHKNETE